MSARTIYDLVVIGGGLAGIHAASRASEAGALVALINAGIPGSSTGIGGFAPFSGAKFSLFPAGTGLSPIVGGDERLCAIYVQLMEHLARSGLRQFVEAIPYVKGVQTTGENGLDFRNYHSVILSPDEIATLLAFLGTTLRETVAIHDTVKSIELNDGGAFEVTLSTGGVLQCARLIHAAGRLGSQLLLDAGVPQSDGKGLDIGVRLEFGSLEPLQGMRRQGPDAKFMNDGIRTFCLNSPGEIFHYPGLGFSLPGGIVAYSSATSSNVAILYRMRDRNEAMSLVRMKAEPSAESIKPLSFRSTGDFEWDERSRAILPDFVVAGITEFARKLEQAGLLDRSSEYTTHYPLFDWHWPVFSLPGTLETARAGVFAAGDTSGHARGLLQAAAMGWIAVEEAFKR